MKANNGSGDNPARDLWQTPKELFDTLNKQYDFNFDCCASKENKKCEFWHDDFEKVGTEEAGLSDDSIAWMNPPFSKAREMFEHFFDVVHKGVAIYRCDNLETRIWQKIIFPNVDWVFIPHKRIAYEGMNGNGSRFPSALIGVGVEPPIELKGTILKIGVFR